MYSKKITWGLIIIVLLTFSCTEKKSPKQVVKKLNTKYSDHLYR